MKKRRTYYRTAEKKQGGSRTAYYLDMVFFGSFFLGIVWANLLGSNSKNRFFMLNEYYFQQLKYAKIDCGGLLVYLLENRIPFLILFLLLSFTVAGILVQILFTGYFGASFGFLCVIAITNFGWRGIVYMGGFLFPHYIFYVLFYFLFLKIFQKKKEGIPMEQREIAASTGILVLLFVLGLLSESYVNPVFLKKLIQIFW